MVFPLSMWLFFSLSREMGYKSIISNSSFEMRNSVSDSLWSLNILIKIACFNWLLIYGRILTWEQLQSRGFFGPSRCVLCKRNLEDTQHLFLYCPFTVSLFSHYAARFGFSMPSFDSVPSLLEHWFSTIARRAV